MKTNKYLLFPIILLLLTSCYIYKPYKEKTEEELTKINNSIPATKSLRNERSSDVASQKTKEHQGEQQISQKEMEAYQKKEEERNQQSEDGNSKAKFQAEKNPLAKSENAPKSSNIQKDEPVAVGIKGKLQPNKYYKITALDHQYKIQVDKWEGDTLISHKIRKPGKQYKFHMNDIQEEAILERVFSKPFSDLLTVGAYASGAAIVLLLVL